MSLSQLPEYLSRTFARLGRWLDRRTAARIPVLLTGILFASGRRTATSWFRAAGITSEFRRAYRTIYAVGRRAPLLAVTAWHTARPCLHGSRRLRVAIDDTPTPRYGPCVEGAGVHHNPTPGPAGAQFVYGHNWVSLAALARHPRWGTVALPLRADLYVRRQDVPQLPREYAWNFRTKLELAVAQLDWLKRWAAAHFEEFWVVVDGGYAKKPFLRPAQARGFTVVGRLRKDAALWSVPPSTRRPGQRGPLPTYGQERLSLAKRAGHSRGWEHVECTQYQRRVTKTCKTFLATWKTRGRTDSRGAGERSGRLASLLLYRPGSDRRGDPGSGGGPGDPRADVQRCQRGVGGRAAAIAQPLRQRGRVQSELLAVHHAGGLGLGAVGGRAGGPQRQSVGRPAAAAFARGQA
jgi:hypothetical protein